MHGEISRTMQIFAWRKIDSNNYFFLWRCQKFIDKCLSSLCQHNSTCTPLINSYRCNCTAGYEGKLYITLFHNSMDKYLFKVKDKDIRKLSTNIVLVFSLLTLNMFLLARTIDYFILWNIFTPLTPAPTQFPIGNRT